MKVKVDNLPEEFENYVVVRKVGEEFWFWGTFDNLAKAWEAASQFHNGMIIERQEIEK